MTQVADQPSMPMPRRNQGGLGRLSSIQLTTLAFLVGLVLVGANSVALFRNMNVLREHQLWVHHTNEVISELDLLLSAMKDVETGERGYIITGNDAYLEPFNDSRGVAQTHLEKVKDLTSDNPMQQDRIPHLQELVRTLLSRYATLVDMRRQQGFAPTAAEVGTGRSKALMDEIREIVATMKRAEAALLSDRVATVVESTEAVDRAAGLETGAIVLFIFLAYLLVRRQLVAQEAERLRLEEDNWQKAGLARLNEILRGNMSVVTLCRSTLTFLTDFLEMPVGTFYLAAGDRLKLVSTFATGQASELPNSIALGENIVGEAAQLRRILRVDPLPNHYLKVGSTLGDAPVRQIIAVPVMFEREVKGVVELGALTTIEPRVMALLESLRDGLGITLDAAQSRERSQELLHETQSQSEELMTQQTTLQRNNEELEVQANSLKSSQERLQLQQEELRQSNEELEQQARILEAQKSDLSSKNADLNQARSDVERKARELELASRYKSEFLANMSHELRTPLNSLLILSTLLAENEDGNLTAKQVDFAKTMNHSGNDLLNLINDVLDLSKVEAGKLEVQVEAVPLESLRNDLERLFQPMADAKGLRFAATIGVGLPTTIRSDRQRLEQIVKNLLSNAIKFTDHGQVTLAIHGAPGDSKANGGRIAISVSDTGIGIQNEKLGLIFEAFQQADGSTSREYGGTGLGLTISRQLAQLLGGEIVVESSQGKGSVFTLLVPRDLVIPAVAEAAPTHGQALPSRTTALTESQPAPAVAARQQDEPARDDRPNRPRHLEGDLNALDPKDRVVLIVEDDEAFGRMLLDQAREAGFKGILTSDGEVAIELASQRNIQGILLDLRLPDMSGLSVLERLKLNPKTRHLPIHIVSGSDFSRNALKMGAVGYLMKPVSLPQLREAFNRIEQTLTRQIKRILIVEDDSVQRRAMIELLKGGDIEIEAVGLGRDAIKRLDETTFDCVILDLRLPDLSGFELLESLDQKSSGNRPPVVVYTGKDLTNEELERLRRYSESIIIKGAKSPERLLDEVSLFLHRVESRLPAAQQAILKNLRLKSSDLDGRRLLLVDDDMRNVFALTNALEVKGINVSIGKNGREALDALDRDHEIEIVLMDVMMPQMDGFEAMRLIRQNPRLKKLPVIALTAKAMRGDQEKCLAAGANDYLPKPVDLEKLFSLIRVWLPSRNEI